MTPADAGAVTWAGAEPLSASREAERRERMADFFARASLSALFMLLAVRIGREFMETGHLTGLLLLVSELLVVVLTVVRRRATIVDRSFVTTERLPVTVALHKGAVRTFVDPAEGREATVVRSVDAEAFADWFTDTVLTPA